MPSKLFSSSFISDPQLKNTDEFSETKSKHQKISSGALSAADLVADLAADLVSVELVAVELVSVTSIGGAQRWRWRTKVAAAARKGGAQRWRA